MGWSGSEVSRIRSSDRRRRHRRIPHDAVYQVGDTALVGVTGLLLLGASPGMSPPGADHLGLPHHAVDRRGAHIGDVLVHHSPGQFRVPQFGCLRA